MKRSLFFSIFFLLFFSCEEPKARRPKQRSTTNFYKELIEKNKQLNEREKRFLEAYILKNTTTVYKTSALGFWYTYVKKNELNSATPKQGDLVTIEYVITDIEDNILYEKTQKKYKVDKQDFIPGLRDGIKLMKQGETITFVVPSYRGYGVTGDGYKIGINQPIKSTIKLINIKQQNNEIK